MIDQLFEQTPGLAERCADFSADRGLDCAETKAKPSAILIMTANRLKWQTDSP
jgi:hypothetical protein